MMVEWLSFSPDLLIQIRFADRCSARGGGVRIRFNNLQSSLTLGQGGGKRKRLRYFLAPVFFLSKIGSKVLYSLIQIFLLAYY